MTCAELCIIVGMQLVILICSLQKIRNFKVTTRYCKGCRGYMYKSSQDYMPLHIKLSIRQRQYTSLAIRGPSIVDRLLHQHSPTFIIQEHVATLNSGGACPKESATSHFLY